MQKVLLSFLIACMGFIPGHALTVISADEKTTTTREENNVSVSPSLMIPAACSFSYDPNTSMLYVHSHIDLGKHAVILENLTAGWQRAFRFRSTPGTLAIPLLGGHGNWRLSVVCSDHVSFSWDFTVDNGIVTCIYPCIYGRVE